MRQIEIFSWLPPVNEKIGSEDAYFVSEGRGIVAVADGVTRDTDTEGNYPNPSPAALAAKILVETAGEYLADIQMIGEEEIKKAFSAATEAVKKLNVELGLWERRDYLERDLAGAVAVIVGLKEKGFYYGYMGDCGAALLSDVNEVVWKTEDRVAKARPYFPKVSEVGLTQRRIRARRDFRNNPKATHPTFGVITGEATAMHYVKTGEKRMGEEELLAVYSDGSAPFVFKEEGFRLKLRQGDREEIVNYIAVRSAPDHLGDDKTLVVVRERGGKVNMSIKGKLTRSGGRELKLAVLAGGCFWCVEANLKILPGVMKVVSGYSGGQVKNPTYQNYRSGGHREAVEVTYDPLKLTYRDLLEFFVKGIDPTDSAGSFGDRGEHYSPAIFVGNEEERRIAEGVLRELDESGRFDQMVAVALEEKQKFWPAEEYHQNYEEKNPGKYERYKMASGREAFRKKYWG